MNKLAALLGHLRFESRAPSDIALQASRFVATGLVVVLVNTACNRAPEVRSPADTKVPESVVPEITPPGWITPQISFLRKPGTDLTGPAAAPDGEPDLVLEVTLEPDLLRQIATWEVHGNANLGNWTSTPNREGWWLIKVETDLEAAQKPKTQRSRIRLCFPDNNDSRISKLTVTASQANGVVLFRQTISK